MNEKPKPEDYPYNFCVCWEDPAIQRHNVETYVDAWRIVLNQQPLVAEFIDDFVGDRVDFYLSGWWQLPGGKRLGWIQRKHDVYEEALNQWRLKQAQDETEDEKRSEQHSALQQGAAV
jgi:hypothetical protein